MQKLSRIVSASRRKYYALPPATRHWRRFAQVWPYYCRWLGQHFQVRYLGAGYYLHSSRSGIRAVTSLPF